MGLFDGYVCLHCHRQFPLVLSVNHDASCACIASTFCVAARSHHKNLLLSVTPQPDCSLTLDLLDLYHFLVGGGGV